MLSCQRGLLTGDQPPVFADWRFVEVQYAVRTGLACMKVGVWPGTLGQREAIDKDYIWSLDLLITFLRELPLKIASEWQHSTEQCTFRPTGSHSCTQGRK